MPGSGFCLGLAGVVHVVSVRCIDDRWLGCQEPVSGGFLPETECNGALDRRRIETYLIVVGESVFFRPLVVILGVQYLSLPNCLIFTIDWINCIVLM